MGTLVATATRTSVFENAGQLTAGLDLVSAYCASPEAILPAAAPVAETDVRIVRMPASGRLEFGELLGLLASGADGVLVTGRMPAPAVQAEVEERLDMLRGLLDFIGYGGRRLQLAWVTAGDGPRYLAAVEGFAAGIQALGPNVLFGEQEPRPGPMSAGSRIWGAHAPVGLNKELQVVAGLLLGRGTVACVLGWGQGRDQIEPLLVAAPEGVRRLFAGGDGYPSLAPTLLQLRGQKTAVVLRPADLWAVEELLADGLLERRDLWIIGQGLSAEQCDIVLAPPTALRALPGADDLAAMETWSLNERAGFWKAQFANCVNCNACRDACPFRCYAQRLDALGAAAASHTVDARASVACHLTCALQLGDRCVLCESCSAACPQGVPLHLLHQKVAQEFARL